MSSLTCAGCNKIDLKGHCHEHSDCLLSRLSAFSLNYRLFTREQGIFQEICLLPREVNQRSCFNTDFDYSNEESRATNVSDSSATSHSCNGNMNSDYLPKVQFHRSAFTKSGLRNVSHVFPFATHNENFPIPNLNGRFPLIPRPIFLAPIREDIQSNSAKISSYYKVTERPSVVQIAASSNKCHFNPSQKPLPRNPSAVSELQRKIEAHQLSSSSALRAHLFESPGYDPRAFDGPSRSRDDELICPECGKEFSSKSKLERHSVVHSKEKSFVCDVCQKCYTQQCDLKRHMLSHSSIKSHKCGECGKTFSLKFDLKVHMRIHTGEQPFTCDTCGKTFSRNWVLKRHALTHTGEKTFTCDICGKAFRDNSNLKRHAAIHERNETV